MIETLKNAWKIADLRKRLLFTALIILIFRIGTAIPVPFLNPTALQAMVGQEGSLLGYLNTLTGGAFANATLFAMSISPYITASIVVQLLTVAIPYLERLAKEGEAGRKQINKITRYATVILALVKSFSPHGSIIKRSTRPMSSSRSLMKWSTACEKKADCFSAGTV